MINSKADAKLIYRAKKIARKKVVKRSNIDNVLLECDLELSGKQQIKQETQDKRIKKRVNAILINL